VLEGTDLLRGIISDTIFGFMEKKMQVTPSNFTVAEYCQQMAENKIVVNRDYQRSGKVWPPAARSYLIETILLGFPIPKLSLYLKTDLKSRQTLKEIVDGQQRSQAIFNFFQDQLTISTKGKFAGRRFSQLDEQEQAAFIEYQLSVDLFVGATPAELREVFRRMNSYTVPLNSQEKRHATHQGEFKWFMVGMTEKYAQTLKDIGVFSENQLTRMNDAVLLSEIVAAIFDGIVSASDRRIDKMYEEYEKSFPYSHEMENRIDTLFQYIMSWYDIHHTVLMKPYNFYSIALAITHRLDPVKSLQEYHPLESAQPILNDYALANLSSLAVAQESLEDHQKFSTFVEACSAGTNRINQRKVRFQYYSKALESSLI
jgi:Protein of unknown function DUF262